MIQVLMRLRNWKSLELEVRFGRPPLMVNCAEMVWKSTDGIVSTQTKSLSKHGLKLNLAILRHLSSLYLTIWQQFPTWLESGMPDNFEVLGTDGFGRSDTREATQILRG